MNASLNQINAALAALSAAGCNRDPNSGFWFSREGVALGTHPTQAAHALRHLTIKTAVEKQRESGRGFTR
jgi:hypothetical protein